MKIIGEGLFKSSGITHSSGPKITDTQARLGVASTPEPQAQPFARVPSRHLGLRGIGTTGSLARVSKSLSTGQARWRSACMARPRAP
jgi:hypothetical protein